MTYTYTLKEASTIIGASQQSIKNYIRRNQLSYSHDSKGRIVLTYATLKYILSNYHPRYWYDVKPTDLWATQQRNELALRRRENTLKPVAYERDTLSLDQLMDKGYYA